MSSRVPCTPRVVLTSIKVTFRIAPCSSLHIGQQALRSSCSAPWPLQLPPLRITRAVAAIPERLDQSSPSRQAHSMKATAVGVTFEYVRLRTLSDEKRSPVARLR